MLQSDCAVRFLRTRLSPAIALTAGLGLVVAAISFFLVWSHERDDLRMAFEQDSRDRIAVLRNRVRDGCLFVESVASFYLGSERVERNEFEAFVAPFPRDYVSLQATEWIARVTDADRASYEAAVRQEGLAGFEITEKAADGRMVRASRRDEYYPVHFVVPGQGNKAALGFDLGSEPVRLAAVRHACDTGLTTATGPIALVQETGRQVGILVLRPIYRRGFPAETVDERRSNLEGFAVGVFRVGDLLDSAIATLEPRGIDVALYDVTESGAGRLLAVQGSHTRAAGGPAGAFVPGDMAAWPRYGERLAAAGRTWEVVCAPTASHVVAQVAWQPWLALAVVLALTAGLTAYLVVARNREGQIVRLAAECTESNETLRREVTERARAEIALREEQEKLAKITGSAQDAIIMMDGDGNVSFWNEAAERIFGHTANEALGKGLHALLAPERFHQAYGRGFAHFREAGEGPAVGRTQQLVGRRKDGKEFPIELSLSAVRVRGAWHAVGIIRDITSRKSMEQELRRLAVIAEQAAEGIAVADLEGNLQFVNNAWAVMHGYGSGAELVGRHLSMFHTDDQLRTDVIPFNEMVKQQGHQAAEVGHKRKDGTTFQAQMVVTLMKDEQGKPYGLAGFAQDITDRKRAEALLAKRTQELASSNAELEQFAYIASHDLQEPLRMVASYVQLLARRYQGKLDADADEFIHFAVDGSARMQTLINDLLTYSRVGTRGKEFAPTDGEAVLQTALSNLEVAIAESAAEVTHDPLPAVMADEVQVVRLFQNLIGNAVKFHGEGPPRVHVSAEQQDGWWTFSVRDNGIGIKPEYHERIFVIFQRLHSREEYEGTGIGLAVCKKIVERHGGRIWLESEEGKGSTFFFTLPPAGQRAACLAAPAEPVAAAEQVAR